MKRTDRFQSLDDVRRERERLQAVRDGHQNALQGYWQLVHEPAFRRGLAGDAFGDMLRSWKPMRMLGGFLRSDDGAIGSALGMVMGSKARTVKGRVFAWAVSLIAPMLLKKYATPERMEHLVAELKYSWDRVRERMRERAHDHDARM
ncbi:MAG: hypothetical protein KF797_08530 [Flavobacteriales bacterium]|nr:hypothetical protein [Flavobacteriales bacterium]